jgi:hypothetical protein
LRFLTTAPPALPPIIASAPAAHRASARPLSVLRRLHGRDRCHSPCERLRRRGSLEYLMIPPQSPISAQYPAAPPAIDAATVLSRLAAGGRRHPGSHPSELRRLWRHPSAAAPRWSPKSRPRLPGASAQIASVSSLRQLHFLAGNLLPPQPEQFGDPRSSQDRAANCRDDLRVLPPLVALSLSCPVPCFIVKRGRDE